MLKKCGDNLTRENVMKQAASLKGYEAPMLLPGIKINTSATDFYPIQAVRLARVKGESFELFGDMNSTRREQVTHTLCGRRDRPAARSCIGAK